MDSDEDGDYEENGVDAVLDNEHHHEILVDFAVTFGSVCIPQLLFNSAKQRLDSGEDNIMSVVGTGMMSKVDYRFFFVGTQYTFPCRSDGTWTSAILE